MARRHDLTVLSDELYEKVVYDDFEHVSIASLDGMLDRTIVINGFSKAYSMTGFRVGYFAGPADYIQAALEPRHSLTISTPTPSQYAALAALTGPQDSLRADDGRLYPAPRPDGRHLRRARRHLQPPPRRVLLLGERERRGRAVARASAGGR